MIIEESNMSINLWTLNQRREVNSPLLPYILFIVPI